MAKQDTQSGREQLAKAKKVVIKNPKKVSGPYTTEENCPPQAISPEELDPEVVARERAIILEQVKESGKPADIAEKMVDGRMRKYFEEVTLLAQTFVIDGETKVRDAIKNAEKDVGAPIKLTKFVRYALGEGIEKAESDFAAEVAATAGVK